MTLTEKLELAQSKAPSYIVVESDGLPLKCGACKTRDMDVFIKYFTSDEKSHSCCHLSCVDEEWLENATKMEFTI